MKKPEWMLVAGVTLILACAIGLCALLGPGVEAARQAQGAPLTASASAAAPAPAHPPVAPAIDKDATISILRIERDEAQAGQQFAADQAQVAALQKQEEDLRAQYQRDQASLDALKQDVEKKAGPAWQLNLQTVELEPRAKAASDAKPVPAPTPAHAPARPSAKGPSKP